MNPARAEHRDHASVAKREILVKKEFAVGIPLFRPLVPVPLLQNANANGTNTNTCYILYRQFFEKLAAVGVPLFGSAVSVSLLKKTPS